MSNAFFEQLQNAGYISRGKPDEGAILRASVSEILEFAQQSCEVTSAENVPRDNKTFSQSASISLGCGRWPCCNIGCRLERAEKLAHYAALYGDRVYFKNFLADHIVHADSRRLPNADELRRRFSEDVRVLAYLKPLIDAGLVVPITPPNYCLHCVAKHSLRLNDAKELKAAMNRMIAQIECNINVSISIISKDKYGIVAEYPPELFGHGSLCAVGRMQKELRAIPHIVKKLKKDVEIKLARKDLKRMGFAEYLASDHFQSIFFELAVAQCLGAGFLTEIPLHIHFLKSLSQTLPRAERDLAIERNLTCLVPFAKELTIEEILSLRKKEAEAFLVFRSALASSVEEYRKNYGSFTEADALALYADVIQPKLQQLDSTLSKSRKLIIKGTTRKVLAWTAAISAGLYYGLLPEGLVNAAKALGLIKVIADIAENAMLQGDSDKVLRNQDMYFLWRLHEKC